MTKSIELSQVVQMLLSTSKKIDYTLSLLYEQAEQKAETERVYRLERSKVTMKLREEGTPATLIDTLSKGEVAYFKFERDLARDKYNATINGLKALTVQASVLQTVSKFQDEI